jgi:rod shape-determining protein MreD
VAYFVHVSHQRIRMSGYRKQAVFVFSMVSIHILLSQWVQNLIGVADISLLVVLQALMSAMLWPLVHVVMTHLCYRFLIN